MTALQVLQVLRGLQKVEKSRKVQEEWALPEKLCEKRKSIEKFMREEKEHSTVAGQAK